MKSIITNELVYFTGSKDRIKDFSGVESSFSPEQRMEFLARYQKEARKWYKDAELNQKACTEEELKSFMAEMEPAPMPSVRRELRLDTMDMQAVYKEPEYENLHLYCGAKAENSRIIFSARSTRPSPCAKIELSPCNEISVSMNIYIPSHYKCPQNKQLGTAQPGRIVEIRNATLDVAKVKLFNTGEIFALSDNMWKPVFTNVGAVKFDEWNSLKINVGETVTVTVNGNTAEGLKKTCGGKIDNIFFDSSMFPHGGWSVKDIEINGKPFEYVKNNAEEEITTSWGKVTLPYALGGYKNRDCRLYLTKKFDAEEFENAVLRIDTLDPCGKVWLNGTLILDSDDFMRHETEVTKHLKNKDNELKIMVEPRPPEVYYYWHRHNDCCNGWFCGEVKLILTKDTYFKELNVITNKIDGGVFASASMELNREFEGHIALYAAKSFPEKGVEEKIAESEIKGKNANIVFHGNFDLWSTDNPNLYTIRAVLSDSNGREIDDVIIETGFRTIEQIDGGIYLNNEKVLLNGALLMQFLPPFDEVPVNHNCPSTEQIAMQCKMLKNMNGNLLRLHMLGYGTNDARYARVCDRMGMMLVWTTRFIDSLETMVWDEPWSEEKLFAQQIKEVINHPSIVIYEGSNEYHSLDLATVDRMYNAFTEMADKVDPSRLLSPVSHLYYGGGIYEMGCKYYNDDGTMDELGNSAISGNGWVHPRVIRSNHPYVLLCGYGEPWEAMRKQDWYWQKELFGSKKHSYIATEYAVTALPNPTTEEAIHNPYVQSYERADEIGAVGRMFADDEWRESQALQGLCAFNATKELRLRGIDGLTWCCLSSGANNGSYMKPPIDFYGYKKLGFYGLRDGFREVFAAKRDLYVSYGTEDGVEPVILNTSKSGDYSLVIRVIDENGNVVDEKKYEKINLRRDELSKTLDLFYPKWNDCGYYTLRFELLF